MVQSPRFQWLFLLLLLGAFACDNPAAPPKKDPPATFTVTFNTDGGSPVNSQTGLASGALVTQPAAPTKSGFIFGGWYKEAGLTNPWTFATDTVTADRTLYAKWTAVTVTTYTVTFSTDGGSPVNSQTGLTSGALVTQPTPPTKSGFTFGGWYKEVGLTNPWTFATDTVTADKTLYAKWTAVTVTTFAVTFNTDGGSPVATQTGLASGALVTQPTPPTKSGFTFGGWYKEVGLTNPWTFATDTVTADRTLYAKWTAVTVAATSVTLDLTSVSLAVNGTQALTATVNPSDATNKAVTWSTNAPSVATVSPTGVVTAIGPGNATITVTLAANNSLAATCAVSVASATVAWAKINDLKSGAPQTTFSDVVVATNGDSYAVGNISGTGTLEWGSVTATSSASASGLLVKFDSTGTALWARVATSASGYTVFSGVALDSNGNVYVAGYQGGTSTTTYNSVTLTGGSTDTNAVLVSYDSLGIARWGAIAQGTKGTWFKGVSVDPDNRITVCGYQDSSTTVTYSATVALTGPMLNRTSSIVVQYSDQGTAQWAKTLASSTGNSVFHAVASDASGNLFCVGTQTGNTPYTYGTEGISGPYAGGLNSVIVKYDSSGTYQWAKTLAAGNGPSVSNAVAVDGSGNAYVAGYQTGSGVYTYGSIALAGSATSGFLNAILVKYDSAGTAVWGKTLASGVRSTNFFSVAVASSGTIYTAGHQWGNGSYGYGNAVSATGPSSDSYANGVIVQWDSSGVAQWARTPSSSVLYVASTLSALALDGSGNPYTAGYQPATSNQGLSWGGFSLYGAHVNNNPILIRWKP